MMHSLAHGTRGGQLWSFAMTAVEGTLLRLAKLKIFRSKVSKIGDLVRLTIERLGSRKHEVDRRGYAGDSYVVLHQHATNR